MVSISKAGERGSARLNFFLFMVVVIVGAYVSYLSLPVAYNAQGYPANWVNDQLKKSASEYGIPADAEITASPLDQRIQVRVQYTKPIEFPGYTYQYEFDHTAKSTEFLTIK